MRKIGKIIFLAITFVIVGLLISSTIIISAIRINKTENKIKIEKLQSELKTETLKYKSYNEKFRVVPQTTSIAEFEFEGDQLHPAFDLSKTGGYMAAYRDSDFENVMWTYTNENAVYYDIDGDYPSIKLWDGTRFFGTLVPSQYDSYGGIVYLFETTDPTDSENQYNLNGWDWSELPDYPGEIMWHDFIDMEMACDNSKEAWEWGFISMVGSTNYDEGYYNTPFITYPTSEDGYATISWYNDLDGCAHTDNTIDHVSYQAYAVYDYLDPEDEEWKIFIRLDYYDNWDKQGTGYVYSEDTDLKYPAVAANDGDLLVVMQSENKGEKDLICFYGRDLEDLETSFIAETDDDEMYPDIAYLSEDKYICTFTKNGNMYGVITENAGQSWGEPFQINDNTDSVFAEYKYLDLSSNGLQAMWEEEDYDKDIWYGSPFGNEAPQEPVINGPPNGKINRNYDFTFTATDPEGDKICYYVDWGDGTNSGWTVPYNSGEIVTLSHNWTDKQAFTITAKARDICGNRGPESTFAFSAPKNIITNLLRHISQFPLFNRIFGL